MGSTFKKLMTVGCEKELGNQACFLAGLIKKHSNPLQKHKNSNPVSSQKRN